MGHNSGDPLSGKILESARYVRFGFRMGFRVWVLGRVWGLGFRIRGGFRKVGGLQGIGDCG